MEAQLNIQVGEEQALTLSNAAGSGYSWVVVENDAHITRVTITAGNKEIKTEGVLGGPVQTTVKIAGLQPGSSRIKIVQKRIWEQEKPPLDTCFYRVTVEKHG